MKIDSRALAGNIVAGAAAGVIAGFILAVSSWLIQEAQDRAERRDQIQTLASLISDYEKRIFGINEGMRFEPDDKVIEVSRDELRKTLYDYLKQRVDSLLDGRASQLTYDEREGVRRAFRLSDIYPRALFSDGNYREMFTELKALEWLGLE